MTSGMSDVKDNGHTHVNNSSRVKSTLASRLPILSGLNVATIPRLKYQVFLSPLLRTDTSDRLTDLRKQNNWIVYS